MHGYLFVNDMTSCTGICLGDVLIMLNERYIRGTSPIKYNYQQFNYMYKSLP